MRGQPCADGGFATMAHLSRLADAIGDDSLRPPQIVSHPLGDAAVAHQLLQDRRIRDKLALKI
jgi:hypothetical protein